MEKQRIEGMGAILHSKGVAFRVWAPHAEQVFVTGTFNEWNENELELSSEDNGYWYIDVEEAKAGDEYKFVLFINDGKKLLKNDPYAKALTNSVGNSIVVDPHFDWEDEQFQMPLWNELIIYEIHVGTFNAPQRDMPGNFKSVVKKIPHLQNLGINAIQIMPPMEFPGDFSWGYNPSYPFAIEESYGGVSDFKVLINEAHKAGIAVILDVVYNHFGPDDMDLWRFDGWYENDKGGIYFYNDWRSKTPWGDTRPDYGRDEVKQYLRDNAMMWLEEFHVDGLRLDATAFIRNTDGENNSKDKDIDEGWAFMQWINREIKEHSSEKITIAEDLWSNAWLTRSADDGGAGFSTQWDKQFVDLIRKNIIIQNDDDRNLEEIKEEVYRQIDNDPFSRIIYTESHDETANGNARLPEEIWPGNVDSWFSRKRSVLGAAVVFTSVGIPMLFQGQEFLEDRWFHDRDPLDWNLADQYNGLVRLYKDLIALRRNLNNTSCGLTGANVEVHHLNNQDKLMAFHRWHEGGPKDSVVVVINFRNQSFDSYVVGLPAAGEWQVRFNSDWKGYDEEFTDNYTGTLQAEEGKTDGMSNYASLSIGPYTVLILSQD